MPDLIHSVPVDASPAEVYRAVATQAGMRGWWTRDTQMQEQTGGKAEFGFARRATVFRMTIDALDPGRAVRMSCTGDDPEWTGTRLEWKVEPRAGGATLHFSHRGWREMSPYTASCNSTWGELMYRLKSYVETGKENPRWTE